MLNRIPYRILAVVLLCGSIAVPTRAQDLVLRVSALSAGAQRSTANNLVLHSTVGQPLVYPTNGTAFEIQGGFWAQVGGLGVDPNAAPTATADAATTDEDVPVEINVLANDNDPGGSLLTVVALGTPEHGEVAASGGATVTYTPDADYFGEDSFVYTVQNEQGAQAQGAVTVTIDPVNDAPAFVSTPVAAVAVDTEYSYAVEASDVEGDGLAIAATTLPSWLSLTDHGDGTATLAGTPTAADVGEHPVTLSVTDGAAASEQAFAVAVTATVPGTPVLIAPADGTADLPTEGVELDWQAVPGATSYDFQLALDPSFDPFESSIVGISDPNWTLFGLAPNTTYYWHVRAANSLGKGPYSETYRFTTALNVAAEDEAGVPASFALHQNYPNPFNPTTTIAYDLPHAAEVRLVVYDLFGRAVRTLVDARQAAGRYTATFDAEGLASGRYYYRIEAGTWSRTRQLVLIR